MGSGSSRNQAEKNQTDSETDSDSDTDTDTKTEKPEIKDWLENQIEGGQPIKKSKGEVSYLKLLLYLTRIGYFARNDI